LDDSAGANKSTGRPKRTYFLDLLLVLTTMRAGLGIAAAVAASSSTEQIVGVAVNLLLLVFSVATLVRQRWGLYGFLTCAAAASIWALAGPILSKSASSDWLGGLAATMVSWAVFLWALAPSWASFHPVAQRSDRDQVDRLDAALAERKRQDRSSSETSARHCPKCGIMSTPTAQRCDCGHAFT
jgi:hypothetical protein